MRTLLRKTGCSARAGVHGRLEKGTRLSWPGDLEHLKKQLLEQTLAETPAKARLAIKRAADEAASLAWATPYPLLVLPELIKEKAQTARQRLIKQENILARSQSILSLAA